MNNSPLAIPTANSEGDRSGHFGHCPLFTLVEIAANRIAGIRTVTNIAHGAGGCMKPVAGHHRNRSFFGQDPAGDYPFPSAESKSGRSGSLNFVFSGGPSIS